MSSNDVYQLSEDDKFRLLKNSRRRQVIDYLIEHDGSVTQSELAETIAAKENGIPVSELRSAQRKRVYVSLYQTHLQKLSETDVVHYDANRGTVTAGPNIDELVPYIDSTDESQGDASNVPYIFLSLLAGGSFIFFRQQMSAVSWLIDLWAAVFVLSAFVLPVYHQYGQHSLTSQLIALAQRVRQPGTLMNAPYIVISLVAGGSFLVIKQQGSTVHWLVELWAIIFTLAVLVWSLYLIYYQQTLVSLPKALGHRIRRRLRPGDSQRSAKSEEHTQSTNGEPPRKSWIRWYEGD